jgi:hypothetical protein
MAAYIRAVHTIRAWLKRGPWPAPHHPWLPIRRMACGYDDRLTDHRCTGCRRRRAESALDQLRALDARHSENGMSR